MRTIAALALVVSLFFVGCATTYRTSESDARFSTGNLSIIRAHGCRISTKSIAGGTHVNDSGLFLDPFIGKNIKTGQIENAGFYLENLYDSSSLYGSPNELGRVSSVVINVDGEAVPLHLLSADFTHSTGGTNYNTVDRSVSVSMHDHAILSLTPEKLAAIIRGKEMAAQVIGSRGSVVYEPSDISRDFREKLARFGVEIMKLEGIELPPPPEIKKAGK